MLLLLLICSGRKQHIAADYRENSIREHCNVSLIDPRPDAATLGHNEKLTDVKREYFLSGRLRWKAVESENRVLWKVVAVVRADQIVGESTEFPNIFNEMGKSWYLERVPISMIPGDYNVWGLPSR